jgi:RNA polymerase sigma-70 factor, ECF subfamily
VDYKKLTDQEVVASALKGRETAYRELIDRYQRPVFSLIYRLVRDRELAEDLAQDSFIKVLNALHSYKPQYKFSSWLFKIAHNTALDHLRKKSPEVLSLEGSPHAEPGEEAQATSIVATSADRTPEEYASDREVGNEIERALEKLRPEYRTVIVLWHIEGRPYEEIAEILDVPLGTAKTYIHRARKELREMLAHLRG